MDKADKEEVTEETPLGRTSDNQTEPSVLPPQSYYPPQYYPSYPAGNPQGNGNNSGYQSYPNASSSPPYPQPYPYPNAASYPPYPQPQQYPPQANSQADYNHEDLQRKRSKQLYCPNCRRYGWTRITLKTGLINHICCGYLCIIGCWLCCWIPYCCDECKDAEHFCEYCNTLLKNEHPV